MAIDKGVCTKESLEYVKGWETINGSSVNDHVEKNHSQAHTAALSFQLMTRAEPPELVIATIQSLLVVKKYCDEIIIIDNNNNDTSMYKPLAAFCASLDPELKVYFYHIDAVEGFKAGALNLALGLMSPDCTHIVVVDSDYQALPHARVSIADAIEQYPAHTLLQFPQFYRNAGQIDIHSELNHYFNHHLYRPFNRERALSTGTYAVIRRSDLLSLGGWSGASITEDAQMGVLMHQQGLRSRFIPQIIATGLLPNTLNDLMSQRRRWIYGNMQVINNYFAIDKSSMCRQYLEKSQTLTSVTPLNRYTINSIKVEGIGERLLYARAHLSQLSAWINFTGLFIFLQICTLLIIFSALFAPTLFNINADSTLLTPLYLVYAGYTVFLVRRLWAYLQDQVPLNKQVNGNYQPTMKMRLRAWLMHLNFWELGALSWLPVMWGREKPFICTPKQEYIRTRHSLWQANIVALPKLLLALNIITALVVAPFSPLYSPILFICALTVCLLKIGAAKVAFDNFAATEPKLNSIRIKSKPAVAHARKQTKPLAPPKIETVFEDKKLLIPKNA
ncbi:glycosyltransferase family 2 protein [Psychrobacter sp. DAB_AL43B]|uniref:glycosyltransferase family 2 protein n=1 Tax=Psychrobacter sp. DAB_AL43B TaxID=1028416 RepID=UPI0009A8F270|nr:glycosyltransferase family 2 protein [Psychrobacter sp. DAB_AL43B]